MKKKMKHMGSHDEMADNAIRHDMSHEREQDGYAVSGLRIKATGEYSHNAMRSYPPAEPYTLEQMSNGSMDYLEKRQRQASSDSKKVKRTEKSYEI